MRRWNKFRALSGREKRFLFAALLTQLLIVPALRVWGFRAVYAFFQRTAAVPKFLPSTQDGEKHPAVEELQNLGWLVNAAANHGPIRSARLTRSLALWWLPRRRGSLAICGLVSAMTEASSRLMRGWNMREW